MEVFEIRDQINDTSDAADLTRLHHNITADIKQIETAFNSSVEAVNQSRALLYAMRLKYYKKVGAQTCYVLVFAIGMAHWMCHAVGRVHSTFVH
jgi:predicted GH43/DUF377 family glycosyl hydrolase